MKVERNEQHLPFEETWLSDGRVDMVEVTRNLGPKTLKGITTLNV